MAQLHAPWQSGLRQKSLFRKNQWRGRQISLLFGSWLTYRCELRRGAPPAPWRVLLESPQSDQMHFFPPPPAELQTNLMKLPRLVSEYIFAPQSESSSSWLLCPPWAYPRLILDWR